MNSKTQRYARNLSRQYPFIGAGADAEDVEQVALISAWKAEQKGMPEHQVFLRMRYDVLDFVRVRSENGPVHMDRFTNSLQEAVGPGQAQTFEDVLSQSADVEALAIARITVTEMVQHVRVEKSKKKAREVSAAWRKKNRVKDKPCEGGCRRLILRSSKLCVSCTAKLSHANGPRVAQLRPEVERKKREGDKGRKPMTPYFRCAAKGCRKKVSGPGRKCRTCTNLERHASGIMNTSGLKPIQPGEVRNKRR